MLTFSKSNVGIKNKMLTIFHINYAKTTLMQPKRRMVLWIRSLRELIRWKTTLKNNTFQTFFYYKVQGSNLWMKFQNVTIQIKANEQCGIVFPCDIVYYAVQDGPNIFASVNEILKCNWSARVTNIILFPVE